MMRSLYSGVSGLKTHQTKMDVIGNNIANVNTVAFKSSSIVFSDLLSQTTQNASGPNALTGAGGTNARQIGLGVKSGAISTSIATQGASQSTGNPFDIMINGDNFFIVNNGSENFFTRDGSFYVDAAGNLAMTSTGYNVMGWGVDETTGEIRQDTVTALRIMSAANMTYPPEATSQAYVSGILDKNDTDVTSANGKVINLNFYDALGYSYTAKLTFKQSADENEYSLELSSLLDSEGNEIDITGVTFGTVNNTQERPVTVSFNSSAYRWNGNQLQSADGGIIYADLTAIFNAGTLRDRDEVVSIGGTDMTVQEVLDNIAAAYGYEGSTEEFLNLFVYDETNGTTPVSVEQMLANMVQGTGTDMFPSTEDSFEADGRFFDGTTITFDGNTGNFAGIGGAATQTTAVLGLSALGGNFSDITVDFSNVSMVDNKGTSTVSATSGDEDGLGAGRRLGDMIGVSIQNNGMIYASYDNGMTKLLGQIATAEFANASGLEKQGDNLYSASLNSGEFDGIGVDITANGGYMSTGQLEMSNVDLSSEFTEMITTQRGFQANSRIITVSDTLLEELTNLKR
ncbi:MAG TPA: flagellar hook-basal body complex protein [Candidatus Acetatifactor stercoripullorum]|uniref:Flagellar hook protein FlgE n=1 Tax=Candidatus Acetatifactor stercoripullorum TaxID=2838414 RepID=A0A9D1UDG0_9FIRM|nr:flagellar hook-basal body complex protein [uncultured Acetatifactor sp.]HIW82561.1 flagellar hook-basal body complex protein [Candidatus Acetatifactor stercoripullorum]